tara:strand:- start:1323 stop:2027 length:705 start_codon:yes stop_codon:yes gene_type:complete
MHTAIIKTLEERQRQIHEEGFTAEHDDKHTGGELSEAAGAYALVTSDMLNGIFRRTKHALRDWPKSWDISWCKPTTDPQRNIIKAMALLSAEYDRIERAKTAAAPAPAEELRYSTDDEWQSHIYDDLNELIEDREREEGDVVYRGVKRWDTATDYTVNLHESVIEGMQLQAEDEAGEAGEDYPDATKPQKQILQALIDAWAMTYCPPDFYTIANIDEITLTRDDIAKARQESQV